MIHESRGPPMGLWVYGYELTPPVARHRLDAIQAILDAGHAEARDTGRIWEGRFVNGDHITHVLVVSDTPARDHDVNRRLEAELVRLHARYSVSRSVAILDD